MRHKLLAILGISFIMAFLLPQSVMATEATYDNVKTKAEGFQNGKSLFDNNTDTYTKALKENQIELSYDDGIGALYIKFDRIPAEWTLKNGDTGEVVTCGSNGFLHEYVDVKSLWEDAPKKVVLNFETGTMIADVFGFTLGAVPDWVQTWEKPCEVADLLLFSSHSDDEQLFFLGMLPYYAGELEKKVQVVYVIQHFEANGVQNHQRPHEQLDGLWTVGVKNYPVISDFPDLYAQSKNRSEAFSQAKKVFENAGVTYDDFVGYLTECIRRFKPSVVVSHDLDGEYGHGTHVLVAAALTEAIEVCSDETQYPESAAEYGVWDIQKLYLHLYEENQIVMNYDIPLETFGGKTAYQVSCDGFACHKSQHWTWFYKWIYGTKDNPYTKASQIKTYSPCEFGLYYTSVGVDVQGGDFLENVVSHEDKVRNEVKDAMQLIIDAKDKMRGVF